MNDSVYSDNYRQLMNDQYRLELAHSLKVSEKLMHDQYFSMECFEVFLKNGGFDQNE